MNRKHLHVINELPHIYELEDMMEFCGKYQKLYIYGYAFQQEMLLKYFDMCGIRIDGYVATWAPKEIPCFCYREMPIKLMEDVIQEEGAGIIVALSDRYFNGIIPKFREKGFQDYFIMSDFAAALREDVKGMKIGIPKDYFKEGLDVEVGEAVLNAARVLEEKGAVVEYFDLSLVDYAVPAYYTIAAAEASSNLERFDGIKYGYRSAGSKGLHDMYKKSRSEGFGEEVRRRIMLGAFVLSSGYYDAYYLKALKVKALIKKAFDEAFEKYDVILSPAAPTTAPKLGESLADPIKMYLGDIYTIAVNLAGLPAISLPCGYCRAGLPVGMQLIGDCFQEKKLIRAAYTYEKAAGTLSARGLFPADRITSVTGKEER